MPSTLLPKPHTIPSSQWLIASQVTSLPSMTTVLPDTLVSLINSLHASAHEHQDNTSPRARLTSTSDDYIPDNDNCKMTHCLISHNITASASPLTPKPESHIPARDPYSTVAYHLLPCTRNTPPMTITLRPPASVHWAHQASPPQALPAPYLDPQYLWWWSNVPL